MNDLRRKIVLSSPLFAVGLLSGCGGGADSTANPAGQTGSGRAQALAAGPTGTSSLQVTPVTGQTLDTVWTSPYGSYLAPNAPAVSTAIRALVNSNILYVTLTEFLTTTSGSTSLELTRCLRLKLAGGAAPTSGQQKSSFSFDSSSNASLVLYMRTRPVAGGTWTEQFGQYVGAAGSNMSALLTSSGQDAAGNWSYRLGLTQARFNPQQSSQYTLGTKALLMDGTATVLAQTQNATWM